MTTSCPKRPTSLYPSRRRRPSSPRPPLDYPSRTAPEADEEVHKAVDEESAEGRGCAVA